MAIPFILIILAPLLWPAYWTIYRYFADKEAAEKPDGLW
jgi:hypothetical protein